MRGTLIVGNWKMNNTADTTAATLSEFLAGYTARTHVQVAFCPSFLSIPAAVTALKGSGIGVGAQDCFWAEKGAFTGFIAVPMLEAAGVSYCVIGHSERRGKFGKLEVPESTLGFFAETDETVNLKLKALLQSHVTAIVCVGETLAERETGQTDAVIRAQISGAIQGIADLGQTVFAYEPVWAIGTGKVCDADEANRVCKLVRDAVGNDSIRVLYGGSMNPANAGELLAKPDIDGGLVGGASLKPADFLAVVNAAS